MTTGGIWTTPTTFSAFADRQAVSREELTADIASRQAAWDWTGMLGLMPDLDPVLAKRGEGAEILDELTGDSHVTAQMQTRKIGTMKREWRWKPGTGPDGEASTAAQAMAQDLAQDLNRVDIGNLIAQILDAPFYGYAPIEIKWQPGPGRLAIRDLEAKPHRWFGFDDQNQPRFISMRAPWEGEPLPFGKFCLARHFPTYANPYGLRLLSRCFWPVMFKKGGMRFWMTFAEKFGMPFLVGYFRQGAGKEEKDEMLANLVKMVRDAVAVVPDGGRVEMLGGKGSGSGSSDMYERLKNAMDAEVSKVLVGQTLTAEVGDKGSYAAGKVHQDVLSDYQSSDQTMVKTVMEEIAWIYGQINAPGVPSPCWQWFEAEDPKTEFATRDKTLQETGIRFTKTYYVRQYGLAEDEFEVSPPSTSTTPPPLLRLSSVPARRGGRAGVGGNVSPTESTSDPQFAEPEPAGLPGLDDLLTAKLAAIADPEISAMVELIRELLAASGDLTEARDRLIELYPAMSTERLAEAMTQALTGATLAGRQDVRDSVA